MHYDFVLEAPEHDYCEHTKFCKRCGLHQQYVVENGYYCVFATNSTPISHLRAFDIQLEKNDEKRKVLAEYIERVRQKLREEHRAEE